MTKEEIKELQDNLISLVPSDIRKSKELTKSDKILLGQLVYLFGMDKAKANGYVFRSNDDLENDTQLSSQTIRFSINRLIKFGAINRTAGSRAEGASVYTLNFEMNGDEITPKITPKNHPYMTKDEVEALIEGLRADYQSQINDLRDEIAELKGVKSDEATPKSPLKITPITPKITPQIQNSEKESTNHSVTSSNSSMGLPICAREENDTDEIAPSNGGDDQTGSVCDFQNKIEGGVDTSQPAKADNESATDEKMDNPNDGEVNNSQATANKASGSVATPQAIQTPTDEEKTRQNANEGANPTSRAQDQTTEDYLNQLDALELWKMNTPNVEPIEIATELGKILKDELYQLSTYKKAEAIGTYLPRYANDLDTLNQIETALTSGHIEKYGYSTPNLVDAFKFQREYLSNPQTLENSPEPHQSLTNQSDEETITNEEKTRENAPDKATDALQPHKTIDALLTKIVNLNASYATGDHEKEEKATKLMNKVCKCCGEIEIAGHLNWCAINIPEILEKHGKVLGTNVDMYLSAIPNVIANRRKEIAA